ncbi:Zinc finger, RING/FYVE/PHD-type [Sesbania bispinosa]|nr:Zinc finger, RING/FYVE/PHD-type [Sesbania bispinosa]
MDEIEVPALFLCPISLQLMRDPVTVCTGITYDRENIARWLSSYRSNSCPVTKQPLLHTDLTPNHTLHSLIQSWCTRNGLQGIENVPIPKPTIDKTHVVKLLSEAKRFPDKQLKCIRRLQSIALESESNKICLVSAGVPDFLASTMMNISQKDSTFMSEVAIEVLFHLNPSGGELKNLINKEGIQFIESLFQVLKFGNHQSKDSEKASKAALKLLVELCSWGRNRVKAVEGGVVFVLVEVLLEASERRLCELMLMVLDKLCGCAEGRAELLKHGAGVAIVAKKILRISHGASDRGVRILASICRYSATPRVLQEMLIFGAVSKLCLVLEVEGSFKAKDRAREILKLHSAVWKNSPCIPQHLLSSYP